MQEQKSVHHTHAVDLVLDAMKACYHGAVRRVDVLHVLHRLHAERNEAQEAEAEIGADETEEGHREPRQESVRVPQLRLHPVALVVDDPHGHVAKLGAQVSGGRGVCDRRLRGHGGCDGSVLWRWGLVARRLLDYRLFIGHGWLRRAAHGGKRKGYLRQERLRTK